MLYFLDVYIANILNPESFGNIKVKLRVLHSAVHILLLGQDGIMLIYLQRYRLIPIQQYSFIRWLTTTLRFRMLSVWFICLCAVICGYYTPSYYGKDLITWGVWMSFAPIILLLSIIDRYFLYLKKYYASYLPRNTIQPILYFLLISTLYHPSEHTLLMLYGFTVLIICIQRLMSFMPYYSATEPTQYEYQREWTHQSWHYWTSVIIIQTSRTVNLSLLDMLSINQNEVGYFSAMLTITLSLYVLTKSVENYLKPWITTYAEDPEKLLAVLKHCNRIRFTQVFLIWSITMIFANTIMLQFGPGYAHYDNALRTLITCYSLYTAGQPHLDLLNFNGYSHDTSKIMVLKFIFMVILAILLIPHYGLWGCLWADGLTSVAAIALATARCKYRLGLHCWQL